MVFDGISAHPDFRANSRASYGFRMLLSSANIGSPVVAIFSQIHSLTSDTPQRGNSLSRTKLRTAGLLVIQMATSPAPSGTMAAATGSRRRRELKRVE